MAEPEVLARVDLDLCVGNAMCRDAAPLVFREGENGQSYVADPRGDSPEAILRAAEDCPVGAISVIATDTHEILFPC